MALELTSILILRSFEYKTVKKLFFLTFLLLSAGLFMGTTVSAAQDGVCGTANGQTLGAKPSAQLCASGTASSVTGSGPWTWTCNGSGSGANASCSATYSGGCYLREIDRGGFDGYIGDAVNSPVCNAIEYIDPVYSGTGFMGNYAICQGNPTDGAYSSVGSCFGTINHDGATWSVASRCEAFAYTCNTAPVGVFDFMVTNGGARTVTQGSSVMNSVDVFLTSGSSQAVSLSVSGLPSGVTGSFSPLFCTPNCTSTLTLTASQTATVGAYTVTVLGTSGGITKTSMFTLTVTGLFEFALTNLGDKTVEQNSSVTNNIGVWYLLGTTQSVSLSVSGLPSGVDGSFSLSPCTPSCSSLLTLSASASAEEGPHTITVSGVSPGGVTRTSTFTLTVSSVAPDYTLETSISPAGSGTISAPGIDCPNTLCIATYSYGDSSYDSWITLVATKSGSYNFGSWSGACAGQPSSCNIFMNGDKIADVTFDQAEPPFNFTLNTGGTRTVTQGSSVTNSVDVSFVAGSPQSVALSVAASSLPSGVTSSLSPTSCSPTCSSTLTLTASGSAVIGNYNVRVYGKAGTITKMSQFSLTVNAAASPLSVTCASDLTTALLGKDITWTASVDSGGTPPFSYSWSGTNISSPVLTTDPYYTRSYSTIGLKTATVTVTDSDSQSKSVTCDPAAGVRINFDPNFEEF